MADQGKIQTGGGQLIPLIVVVVILVAGYVVLDMYGEGQKDMLTVETRGLQMISALGAYRRDQGGYPDALDKLVPKHAAQVSKCPNGEPMAYAFAGGEYVLSCRKVVFKEGPYGYDSRTKSWSG